jgi:hypothetical protein
MIQRVTQDWDGSYRERPDGMFVWAEAHDAEMKRQKIAINELNLEIQRLKELVGLFSLCQNTAGIEALKKEVDRNHADARRYRWLRDTPGIKTYIQGFTGSGRISGIHADVEIDDQMRNPL